MWILMSFLIQNVNDEVMLSLILYEVVSDA